MPTEIETAKSAMQHAGLVAPTILAALSTTNVDIPKELSAIPGADAILKDIISRVTDATTAVGEILGSIDVGAAAQAVQSRTASPSTINEAALKAAVAKLGAAFAVDPLLDKIEKILSDKGLQARAKQGFAARGLTGGVDDVRGALKAVTANNVDPAFIRGVIVSIENQEQLLNSPAAKASLLAAVNNLYTILHKFNRDVRRLMTIIDTTLGATFN
jgi:hypothetical protein